MTRKHAAFVFERVPEGDVGDVVQQGGNPDKLGLVRRHGIRASDRVDKPLRHPGCSEGMFESGVKGRWEHEIRGAKLLDATETLEFRGVDELDLQWPQPDIPVDGIAD